jgi:hypothetical protein
MLCSLLKALLALHCRLALYYVEQSGAAGLRLGAQSRLVCPRACVVTRVDQGHIELSVKNLNRLEYRQPENLEEYNGVCDRLEVERG